MDNDYNAYASTSIYIINCMKLFIFTCTLKLKLGIISYVEWFDLWSDPNFHIAMSLIIWTL